MGTTAHHVMTDSPPSVLRSAAATTAYPIESSILRPACRQRTRTPEIRPTPVPPAASPSSTPCPDRPS